MPDVDRVKGPSHDSNLHNLIPRNAIPDLLCARSRKHDLFLVILAFSVQNDLLSDHLHDL